jgi:hypothetical protein
MKAYNPANPSGQQFRRAVEAFGKPGENNGVQIGFGNSNEAAAKDETKGAKDSPDSLLFICTFNTNRLTGDAETRAIVFAGENVANLRTPIPGGATASLSQLDDRAWVTTILDVVAGKQKTLTLPGGYLVWNSIWPPADANQKVQDAVTSFLSSEELLSK